MAGTLSCILVWIHLSWGTGVQIVIGQVEDLVVYFSGISSTEMKLYYPIKSNRYTIYCIFALVGDGSEGQVL